MNDSMPVPEDLGRNERLARHTTWRIGGPADFFVQAHDEDDLAAALQWARDKSVPCEVLGSGSNVLVSDEGFRGLVVVYARGGWRATQAAPDGINQEREGHQSTLDVAGNVPLARLARTCTEQGLAGLEWAIGIPGTIGGAIAGNAGAHGGSIADVVTSVRILSQDHDVEELSRSQLGFSYRSSVLRSVCPAERAVIVSAKISLHEAERTRLVARAAELLDRRRRTQPMGLSAGSVFRNPEGDSAGRLIEAAGLKGTQIGGARVSLRHANFIINCGDASAHDVRALMALIQERVWAHSGVALQPEIVFLGEGGNPSGRLWQDTATGN